MDTFINLTVDSELEPSLDLFTCTAMVCDDEVAPVPVNMEQYDSGNPVAFCVIA